MNTEPIILGDHTNNNTVGVTDANELKTYQNTSVNRASVLGESYTINSADATAAAGEYPIYLKNDNTAKDFVITKIESYTTNAAADAEWILTTVTGTPGGAGAITPANTNVGSTVAAALTCHGDNAVTGLTPVTTIKKWYQGIANTTEYIDFQNALVVPYGVAIAIEADAGTTGVVRLTIHGYFRDK